MYKMEEEDTNACARLLEKAKSPGFISSPFFLFVSEMVEPCCLANRSAKSSEIMELLAAAWKTLENKREWVKKFNALQQSKPVIESTKRRADSMFQMDSETSKRTKLTLTERI